MERILMTIFVISIILGSILLMIGIKFQRNKNQKKLGELGNARKDKKPENIKLKEETFNLYKKLETAKTKNDLTTLKEILTSELYKKEEQKLNQLKSNNQKIVATNIKLEESKVLYVKKDKTSAIVFLHVSQYDYVIDKKKNIVRGTDEALYQIEYKITIEKEKGKNFKIKKKECTGKWIKN